MCVCPQCVFNHDGNMFAAVNKKVIHVYNIRTGKKLDLNAHLKKVSTNSFFFHILLAIL